MSIYERAHRHLMHILPMRFTLKQLTYFVAAAEAGTVVGAAARVSISPPSISSAIAQLEQAFGVQLFVRHHAQGLTLTQAGQTFLRATKLFLQHAEELQDMAGDLSGRIAGPLDVGCLVTLAPMLLPDLCLGFEAEFPGVKIAATEGNHQELVEKLRRAEISACLTYDLAVPPDVKFEPLVTLPAYALLAADDPLAQQASVKLEALIERPFILLDLPSSTDYFMSIFAAAQLRPSIRTRSRSPEVIRSMVAEGHGYALANVRPLNRCSLTGRELAYVPLDGRYPPMVIGIATLLGSRTTRLLEAFIERCRTRVSPGGVPGMGLFGAAR
jgi:DNA-binding transcriptional LysR family regulator